MNDFKLTGLNLYRLWYSIKSIVFVFRASKPEWAALFALQRRT